MRGALMLIAETLSNAMLPNFQSVAPPAKN
jgi:hypothetical protein